MIRPEYLDRMLDQRLSDLFSELPAILISGPRATGKTTTARRHARSIVRLDRPAEAAVFRGDPDAALKAQSEPILLDEWQTVPEVLGAVKRAVDDDPRPGRFILTGSVSDDLDAETWPGTGRVVRLAMYGLTMRELVGRPAGETFVEKLARDELEAFSVASDPPDLRGYVELALRGGFPDAVLRLSGSARPAWLEGYLDRSLTRDAAIDGPRDPARLRRYFEALALSTAGLAEHKTLYDAAGINRKTAVAYDRLLTNLFLLDTIPAWSSNRLSRLVRGPKRYLVDPSLVGAALGIDMAGVMRDGDLLGRIIDTFVAAQLRPEVVLATPRSALHHLREHGDRREIDLVIELGGGTVVAIEVKASASPDRTDAHHLTWLRDTLGDRFRAGAVLHTGPQPFRLSDRVMALPICSIWG